MIIVKNIVGLILIILGTPIIILGSTTARIGFYLDELGLKLSHKYPWRF